MSQITRCPSCATSFKVVADQLRISEGWVRCGQCKEVFDASAHLVSLASPALLPDVSLTDVQPPPAPVACKTGAASGWGAAPVPAVASAPVRGMVPHETLGSESVQRVVPPGLASRGVEARTEAVPPEAWFDVPFGVSVAPGAAATTPALEIPSPAVPAFLAAGADVSVSSAGPSSLSPVAPFAWRSMPQSLSGAPTDALALSATPHWPDAVGEALNGGGGGATAGFMASDAGKAEPVAGLEKASLMPECPAAYPLPPTPLLRMGLDTPLSSGVGAELPLDDLPTADFVQSPAAGSLAMGDAATVLHVIPTSTASRAEEMDGVDDAPAYGVGPEVSFVVTARRKAFWRKPAVRVVLGLVILVLTLGLAAQVVVQERDRIAAMDARARPWLLRLCEPLRCEIAPQRQIADLVIDSSSFNKARGDGYQLAFTMKSKADIPLATPAVELTLTDAQDQPVLRRVLLPTDMAAPTELRAHGEWSASVSVVVTTGGARIAGYRILVFYP